MATSTTSTTSARAITIEDETVKEERLCSVYPTGTLKGQIKELTTMQEKYGPMGFAALEIREERNCGHPFHCECTPGYALFGKRPEKGDKSHS